MIRSASFTCVNNSKGRSGHSAEPDLKYNNNNNGGGGGGGSRRTSHQKSAAFYSSEEESESMYSPNSPSKKSTTPKPSPISTRQYLGLSLQPSGSSLHHHHHNSPPSLPADFSDLASVTSNEVDLTSSPGSPRRKVNILLFFFNSFTYNQKLKFD